MIKNPNHVRSLRDAMHGAINQWGIDNGIDAGGLDSGDAVTAIAMVLRDIVKSGPDSYARSMLARAAIGAIEEAGRGPIIMPAGHA